MDFSTLTAKWQVTIPKVVRDALGLKRGDLVSWEIEGESVRLRVVSPLDLGKLAKLQPAITDLPALLRADGFQILSIAINHAVLAGAYCQIHRDPFDRMLAAQAELEQLVLITADSQLAAFPYRQRWDG